MCNKYIFTSQDVERGVTHSDLYILSLEDKRSTDTAPVRWKWQNSKPGGDKPSPRSGASSVQVWIETQCMREPLVCELFLGFALIMLWNKLTCIIRPPWFKHQTSTLRSVSDFDLLRSVLDFDFNLWQPVVHVVCVVEFVNCRTIVQCHKHVTEQWILNVTNQVVWYFEIC